MSASLKINLKSFVASLNPASKDAMYRYLWADYVRNDIHSRIEALQLTNLSEDECEEVVETVVQAYVYDGDYDCDLSYWENIDNLILDACIKLDLQASDH